MEALIDFTKRGLDDMAKGIPLLNLNNANLKSYITKSNG